MAGSSHGPHWSRNGNPQQEQVYAGQDRFREPFRGRCNRCGKRSHMKRHCKSYEEQGRVALEKEREDGHKPEKPEPARDDKFEAILVQIGQVLACPPKSTDWYVDSGATSHFTNQRNLFISIDNERLPRDVVTASNERPQRSSEVGRNWPCTTCWQKQPAG